MLLDLKSEEVPNDDWPNAFVLELPKAYLTGAANAEVVDKEGVVGAPKINVEGWLVVVPQN